MSEQKRFKVLIAALVVKPKLLILKKVFLLKKSPLFGFKLYRAKEFWKDFGIRQILLFIQEANKQHGKRVVDGKRIKVVLLLEIKKAAYSGFTFGALKAC